MSASRDQADRTDITFAYADIRWFGVPPALALLLLSGVASAIALALFATSHWPYGLILLGLAALLLAAFLEVARRRPDSRLTSYAAGSAASARDHAAAAVDRLLARSSAAAEAQRVRGAQAVIEADRRTALLQLGEAVHRGDETAADAARARLADLEAMEEELRERLAERLASTEERIRRSRLSVQRTMIVRPSPDPEPEPDEDTRRPAA
jgi:hypothetical protein